MHFTFTSLLFAHSVASAAISSTPAAALTGAEPQILRAVTKRQVEPANFTPGLNVRLHYGDGGDEGAPSAKSSASSLFEGSSTMAKTVSTTAVVDGKMRFPSIVLEDIKSIKGVSCATKGSVKMSFTDAGDFAEAKKKWPQKDAIIITTSAGSCAADGQRGLYKIKAIKYDDAAKSATVTADVMSVNDAMVNAEVGWGGTNTPTKSFDIPLSFDLSGRKLTQAGLLTITADVAKYTGNIRISGSLKYNFETKKLEQMFVDLDYNSVMDLGLTTALTVKANYNQMVKFSPVDATLSAFSIPGILDVGPMLSFNLGFEVGASGSLSLQTTVKSTFKDSKVHIDLLDTKSSKATGWKPVTTLDNKASAAVSLQLNPHASLSVGMGVKAFGGLVDLTASIEAKPTLVNTININAQAVSPFATDSGLSFKAPADAAKTCTNGAWAASTLHFGVTAKLGPLAKDLYTADVPVYKSQCFKGSLPKPKRDVEFLTGRRIAV